MNNSRNRMTTKSRLLGRRKKEKSLILKILGCKLELRKENIPACEEKKTKLWLNLKRPMFPMSLLLRRFFLFLSSISLIYLTKAMLPLRN